MKIKFSKSWKASKQPRKQRKYTANAPLHIKRKMLGVNLSKELRKKFSKRNIELRKNDVVKIMRGKFKKKQGKILSIDTKKLKIYIEGIQVKKQDGSKVNVKMQPSNLQIIELNLEDKKRMKRLDRERVEKNKKIAETDASENKKLIKSKNSATQRAAKLSEE